MLTQNEAKWAGKVKIIGLSIDKDAETVKKHCAAKGWNKPIHYWRNTSDCSDVYSVGGVPHVMLIDTQGKIVFKGHPANRKNLVEDFDKLLAGETLEGEGCAPKEGSADVAEGAAEDDGSATKEGYKNCDDDELAGINAEMTNFKDVIGK